jgi:hypothetical protein
MGDDTPADLAELERIGVRLLGPTETTMRVVGGRVAARISLSDSRTMLIARVVARGTGQRGSRVLDHSRALLVHVGGDRPASFTIRARHLGDAVRAFGSIHLENQGARRDRDRSLLRVVDLPRALLDVADEAACDAQTVVIAASRAFLELDDDEREQLIQDARYSVVLP